ncbi:hypothetical protein [Methylobacterium nodulans]|uniref:Uncharacterized protein n=1 Tax=Methylobacterium nodulans (strain LMG 21967 / CNCM I-2342 / ORS 2060) TaxID=460265 RepID=B8IT04_METNO|nr:hypothetical protein [Methylobacterium nodulans]ACL55066.1 conserved hypothetical protein [Methylobacterium nodulans ORS 2060]
MSDGKDQAGASAPGTSAASAEASLKDAVTSARAALPKAEAFRKVPAFRLKLRPPIAAALLGGLCLGSFGGGAAVALLTKGARAERPAIGQAEWKKLATRLDAQAAESARLATDIKLLKDRTAEAHDAAEKARAESGTRFGQLAERLDRLNKVGGETATKLAGLSEKLDHFDREQSARVTALGEKVERQRSAAPAAPAPAAPAAKVAAAEPALTGSLPDKPAAKPAPTLVDGWTLRDVYDGVAMIENRNRRLVEVGPGDTVPGIGRVEAIERRGKTWVVVTNRGLITSQLW